ncbi:MAG: DUF3422 family protein [Parvularcula sp.]
MTDLPEFHPKHKMLVSEAFARPSVPVDAPAMAARLSLTQERGTSFHDIAAHHLGSLCRELGEPCAEPGARHHVLSTENWTLVWERHTEFLSITIIETGRDDFDWDRSPLRLLPDGWLRSLPGKMLSLTHIAITAATQADDDLDRAEAAFGFGDFSAAYAAHKTVMIAADFRPDENESVRIIIFENDARPDYLGRLMQRLFEIDFYRLAALLSLPVARKLTRNLNVLEDRLEASLESLVSGMGDQSPEKTNTDDETLLMTLSGVAAEIERLEHETRYRFDAAEAYYRIVQDRAERLRETQIEGHQRISTFMDHRLGPAIRTCGAAGRRLEHLSSRVGRALDLLGTKISLAVEKQNAERLQSLNTRTETQLRLQETVEGLSTVAISYYAVGLIQYLLKAFHDIGGPDIVAIGTGIAIPLVLFTVYMGLRSIKKKISSAHDGTTK